MATAEAAPPKADFRAVELVWRLEEPKERPARRSQTPDVSSPLGPSLEQLLDPAYSLAATAPLFWSLPDGEAVEIPFRDPAELQFSLEFEYVLGGPEAVDRLLRQLDIAAFRAIAWHPEGPLEEAAGGDRRRLILGEVRRHPALFSRIQEPVMDMASLAIPWEAIDSKESAAWTNDVTLQLSPLVYKKVVLEADDAVSDALAAIQEKARAALQDVEKVAKGMLLTALDSARNEIVREGFRYFDFKEQSGLVAAFARVKHPLAKAEKEVGAKKPSDVKKFPLAKIPGQLQGMLKTLKSFAEEVVNAEQALRETPPILNPISPMGPNPQYPKAVARLEKAKETLAKEVGKFREGFPVVLRMTAEEILRAPAAKRDELGAILFPILARAWEKNGSMRAKAQKWALASAGLVAGRWPEEALAARLKRDTSVGSVWRHRKYVERALSRVFPEPATVEYVAASGVLEVLHPKTSIREIVGDVIRDLAIFHGAGKFDKAMAKSAEAAALGAAEVVARKLPRLVPVLNWVFAGSHIYSAIRDFGEQGDLFYCTLDPTDALTELEPKLGELLEDIATEVAFALI